MEIWKSVIKTLRRTKEPLIIDQQNLKPIADYLRDDDNFPLDEDSSLALLYMIESEFCALYKDQRLTKDSQADAALERMARNYAADPGDDSTFARLQIRLQTFLSLNPEQYSRGDIRRACNKIRRSVARHRDVRDDACLRFILKHVV